jgi:hypothetical protein
MGVSWIDLQVILIGVGSATGRKFNNAHSKRNQIFSEFDNFASGCRFVVTSIDTFVVCLQARQ